MTSAAALRPPVRLRRPSADAALGALAAVAATVFGLQWPDGSRLVAVGALALVFAIAAVVLAVARFELFVLGAIVARSSLDALKPPGQAAAEWASPAAGLALLFLLSGTFWIAARRRRNGPHPSSLLQTAALGVLAAAALSVPFSNAPSATASELLRLAAGVMMLLIVERLVKDERDARTVLMAVLGSAIVPLAVGAVAGSRFVETKDGISRLTSTFTQSNPLAHYCLALLLVCAGLIRHLKGRARVGIVLLGGALLGTLFLTYTRNAWIGLVVGLIVIGALESRRLLVGLVVGMFVVVVAVPPVTSRLTEATKESAVADKRETSLAWRVDYWRELAPLAAESPATGLGLRATTLETDEQKLPHNDYLRAFVETGLIGFIAYVGFVIAMIVTGLRAVRVAAPGLQKGIAVGFLSYAVAFAVVSAVENLSTQVVILWYVLPVAALANWIARSGTPASASD